MWTYSYRATVHISTFRFQTHKCLYFFNEFHYTLQASGHLVMKSVFQPPVCYLFFHTNSIHTGAVDACIWDDFSYSNYSRYPNSLQTKGVRINEDALYFVWNQFITLDFPSTSTHYVSYLRHGH